MHEHPLEIVEEEPHCHCFGIKKTPFGGSNFCTPSEIRTDTNRAEGFIVYIGIGRFEDKVTR